MTTIAFHYEDKEIAVDSRVCCGSVIMTDSRNKIIEKGDLVFVLSGDNASIDALINSYPCANGVSDAAGFLVKGGVVYAIDCRDDVISESVVDYNDANGDGYSFALSAMDYGCSAHDAVEYAKARNCKTGGKVNVIKVK